MTKIDAMLVIPRLLDQYWFEDDEEFATNGSGKLLDEALAAFGCPPAGFPFDNPVDYGYACTLAAALDYFWDKVIDLPAFEDALKKACACVDNGKYRHCVDVEDYEAGDYETIGEYYFFDACGFNVRLPQLIIDRIDMAAIGKDVAKQERGKFTYYGYFAPEKYNG